VFGITEERSVKKVRSAAAVVCADGRVLVVDRNDINERWPEVLLQFFDIHEFSLI
jgi:hypothetical protein